MTDSDDPARPHYSPEELAQAVATVPRFAREVFLLHRSDGLSYAEIADHLGISEAT